MSAGITQPLSQQYRLALSIEQGEVKEDMATEFIRLTQQDIAQVVPETQVEVAFRTDGYVASIMLVPGVKSQPRLRPILITISATTLALIPLAIHGGPLWQGLCFAQIGGLFVATFGTLLFVPTLYAFVVMDLKAIKWQVH